MHSWGHPRSVYDGQFNTPKYNETRKTSRRFLQARPSSIIVLQEPGNGILERLVERREFETAYEAQQLFV
jgi:hypothetical protein